MKDHLSTIGPQVKHHLVIAVHFRPVYRLTSFADDNPSVTRGKCSLELAGYDLDALPIAEFFRNLKLPTLDLPDEEVVPMP